MKKSCFEKNAFKISKTEKGKGGGALAWGRIRAYEYKMKKNIVFFEGSKAGSPLIQYTNKISKPKVEIGLFILKSTNIICGSKC